MLDIFRNPAFNLVSLTDSFNVIPNSYGRLRELGAFPVKPIRSTMAVIERQHRTLNVLPSVPRGGPASKGSIGKRDLRAVEVPHFPHEDNVLAVEVMGVRKYGTEQDLEAVQDLMNEKLDTMAAKHDETLEYLRWSALSGFILDPVSGAVILNLFDLMGASETVFSWDLANSSADLKLKANALLRFVEQNLFGASKTGIRVFAGPDFMDAFTTHPSVKDAYDKYNSSQEPLRTDVRKGFNWQGIIFEEQVGSTTRLDGTVLTFVPADQARVYIEGSDIYQTYVAPANFMETVNQPGQLRYAKQELMKWDMGVELHTQSNPLPFCKRPQLLVRLTKS